MKKSNKQTKKEEKMGDKKKIGLDLTTRFAKVVTGKIPIIGPLLGELIDFGYHYFKNVVKKWNDECEKEKIDYFINCVKSGYSSFIDNSMKMLFLSKLSEYSNAALELLNYLSITHYVKQNNYIEGQISVEDAIINGLPKFGEKREFLRVLLKQLQNDGFIREIKFNECESESVAKGKRTTNFGDEFLEYIKEKDNGKDENAD